MAINLYQEFAATVARQPASPAILGPGQSDAMDYRALDGAIRAASDRLAHAGVRPGDCIGLHCASGAEYIILTYAVWRCGGCVVPIPLELAVPEKEQVCREIALDFVINRATSGMQFLPPSTGPGVTVSASSILMPVKKCREHPSGFQTIDSAFIRFTSGTTGDAKGVVLSHQSICDRIHAANDVLWIGPDDRIVWVLSMAYHFTVSIVSYLHFGAAIVLPPNHFAKAIAVTIRRHEATLLYASPTHYRWLAEHEAVEFDSLRLAISSSASLDRETGRRFQERFGLPITQALGMIEIGLPCINLDFAAERPEAVGRVLPAYECRMEDAGLGPDVKELWFRGNGFLDAYYHPWRPRHEIMSDGWFHTGDVARVDLDGCLYLCGRTKDVINVMGMKVFPQEVESVLASHPMVHSACVYAQHDARLGEAPCAHVVLKESAVGVTEGDLLRYCGQRLGSFKVPRRILFARTLPRTPSGKLLRAVTGAASSD